MASTSTTQQHNYLICLLTREAPIEAHKSRRPLDRLTLTIILTLTFDLIFIARRGIVMDYPCAKFGDFSFSRFDFIVRTDRQNVRITEADDRYTHATTVGVSNNT